MIKLQGGSEQRAATERTIEGISLEEQYDDGQIRL